jgi:hypothetical protein
MLAARLGVSTLMVRAWLADALPAPRSHFFRVIDILHEADPEYAAFKRTDEQPSGNAAY